MSLVNNQGCLIFREPVSSASIEHFFIMSLAAFCYNGAIKIR